MCVYVSFYCFGVLFGFWFLVFGWWARRDSNPGPTGFSVVFMSFDFLLSSVALPGFSEVFCFPLSYGPFFWYGDFWVVSVFGV